MRGQFLSKALAIRLGIRGAHRRRRFPSRWLVMYLPALSAPGPQARGTAECFTASVPASGGDRGASNGTPPSSRRLFVKQGAQRSRHSQPAFSPGPINDRADVIVWIPDKLRAAGNKQQREFLEAWLERRGTTARLIYVGRDYDAAGE